MVLLQPIFVIHAINYKSVTSIDHFFIYFTSSAARDDIYQCKSESPTFRVLLICFMFMVLKRHIQA